MSNTPSELKYIETHEWIRIDGDIATVGITDHAQDALGDVVFFEAPQIGVHYSQGAACAVVESVKAASDIYAPLSGEVVEVNQAIADAPETINSEPYQAWLFKMKIDTPAQLEALLSAAQYEALIA